MGMNGVNLLEVKIVRLAEATLVFTRSPGITRDFFDMSTDI